jgi:hypothetical protein
MPVVGCPWDARARRQRGPLSLPSYPEGSPNTLNDAIQRRLAPFFDDLLLATVRSSHDRCGSA